MEEKGGYIALETPPAAYDTGAGALDPKTNKQTLKWGGILPEIDWESIQRPNPAKISIPLAKIRIPPAKLMSD